MSKTVVGLYDDFGTAQRVVQDLVDNGIARSDISLVANDASGEYSRQIGTTDETTDVGTGAGVGAGIGAVLGGIGGLLVGLGALAIPGIGPVIAAGPLISALAGAGIGAVAGGLVGALVDMGVPEEEAGYYAEGVRRGGTLVTVNSPDDMADRVVDIMNMYNPVDIDERAVAWQASGWTPSGTTYSGSRSADYETTTTRDRSAYRTDQDLDEGDNTFEVVEEDLNVGKREVDRGGVRLHTRVTEQPVEETVNLREEHVHVDRRPVDRPADEADLNAFEEGTVEVTARAEEPVVAKRARVVEEVTVNKDVDERTETIQDTVRRKDVEVEDLGATGTRDRYTVGTSAMDVDDDWDTYDTYFHQDYNTHYANSGYTYDRYQPAYRYGYDLAHDRTYAGRSWAEIEPEARRYWSEEHTDSAWEDFKDAVRHAWERTKDAVGIDEDRSRGRYSTGS